MFFAKYTLFAEKMVLHEEKSFILKIFLLKKTFFTEKNIYENVNIYIYIYIIIFEIYFYAENVCVTNKIQIFLEYIYSFCKKSFFDHKKYIC